MTNINNSLFLHGGPGLHSDVERAWFGDVLPVLWWDQPVVAADNPAPFQTLVDSAAQQLQALADLNGGQADLVAHSYGSRIAAALAGQHPALIRRIILLGSMSTQPFRPFLYLGQNLLDAGYERPGLQAAMKTAEEKPDQERFVALIQACFPDPFVPGIYFGSGSAAARDRYLALASVAPPADFATFFAVMFEALRTPPPAQVEGFSGEVVALLGRQDPVLHIDESTETWRGIFPQAQFRTVDGGHFLHLELPPAAWLGR